MEGPEPGSAEYFIEEGFSQIQKGLYMLYKEKKYQEAEIELDSLISLFTQDHLIVIKKQGALK